MKKLFQKSLVVVFALTMFNFAVEVKIAPSVDAAAFDSCKALLKQYKSGVAVSKAKRGQSKAAVNSKIYRLNKALDVDNDGVACDKDDRGSKAFWAPVEYSGTGSFVQDLAIPADQPAIAEIVHNGASNFVVWGLDSKLSQSDLLVNHIGVYSGTVLINRGFSFSPTDIKSLEIDADGVWSAKVSPATTAKPFKKRYSGTGDFVLRYEGKRSKIKVSHDGSSNFVITTFDSKGLYSELVVNEIGNYQGTVILPSDAYIVINADGNWSISK